jgi:signal peptidase II
MTPLSRRIYRAAAATGLWILILDQISKWSVLGMLQRRGTVELLPFFDLQLAWNRGVSFGLFNHGDPLPPWVFVVVAALISAGLLTWLRKVDSVRLGVAIGAILGGAIGNSVDRLAHGAVVDFLHFHLADYSWPNFNVADSAIVIGVAIIILDGFVRGEGRSDGRVAATQEGSNS